VLCLLAATVVFYWQILLTRQFSLLTGSEEVNQAYSWLNLWVGHIRQGVLPLWDPYTFAGHSFSGEMQTAVFYPLNLLLALFPFTHSGVFSPALYHEWFALAHFLAACFMFALAREMGIGRFASLVSGITFSFGGLVVHAGWLDMLESAIWLPLVFLFLLRALRASGPRRAALWGSLAGLFLGMTILAGRLHVTIMAAIVVASAAAFAAFEPRARGEAAEAGHALGRWIIPAVAAAAALAVALCAGAIQIFPSMEYSGRAMRFLGGALPPWPADQKIPYAYLSDGLWPHGILTLLLPFAFNGNAGPGEFMSPYMGVFPLLAAVVALRRCWNNPWVRYLAGLGAAALLYALGSYSLLHGFLYAAAPRLWMAREAGRFVYLADFAIAILAAFGVEALLSGEGREELRRGLGRGFTWIAIAAAAGWAVPAFYNHPDLNPWVSFSLLMILLSYGLFRRLIHGPSGTAARLLIAGLILFDLGGVNWTPRNIVGQNPAPPDFLARVLSCRNVASFLKSKPGPFRVRILSQPEPNIGDVFGVPTLHGMSATLTKDFMSVMGDDSLLNVRYLLRPAQAADPNPIYQDANWKLFEAPPSLGAAWIVHRTLYEPSQENAASMVNGNAVDLRRQALMSEPVDLGLSVPADGAVESVAFQEYGANRLALTAHASGKALLVLSEFEYPGWKAKVNGQPAPIYRVDAVLRGIPIPDGASRVELDYRPATVSAGAGVSAATFLAVGLAFALSRKAGRP